MKFIAFHSEDPRVLQALELDLLTSRQFDWVGRPHNSGWVVAHSGLSPLDRRDNTFFVEGGERLAGVGSGAHARRAPGRPLKTRAGDCHYACFPRHTRARSLLSGPEPAPTPRGAGNS